MPREKRETNSDLREKQNPISLDQDANPNPAMGGLPTSIDLALGPDGRNITLDLDAGREGNDPDLRRQMEDLWREVERIRLEREAPSTYEFHLGES